MKKITTRLFVALAVGSLLMVSAFGQGRARGRFYSKSDVDRIIKRVETRSDEFKDAVDKALDRSRLDGTSREDNINEQVKELEKALDNLRSDFDRRDTWRETHNEVRSVLRQADEVGRIVRRNRFPGNIQRGWTALRADLNTLAGIYNLPRLRY
jgi:hypothetical protein